MPKYYVQSGQIKHIIQRNTHYDAIVSVLKIYRGKGLVTSIKICVSETGWKKKLTCYDTDTFLKEIL
ncbi:MAG: hypothetical protein EBZ62_00320 [Sphingobacteriia bacterium]|nr:hypothetical protein [Sphingobacteriia bacterium]